MREKSLFINGAEVASITEEGKYLICVEEHGWDFMAEVSKEEFKTYLKRFDWILSGWCIELKTAYQSLLKEVA